jgi:CheY-like chemotaxis protein
MFGVSLANNGFEALQFVKETLDDQDFKFDLVILDLNMPIMNGHEACRQIKQLFSEEIITRNKLVTFDNFTEFAFSNQSNPVKKQTHKFNMLLQHIGPVCIALSASQATEGLVSVCKSEGFDSYIEAPLSVKDIRNYIYPLMEKRQNKILDNIISEIFNEMLRREKRQV